jgi:hypothetical protein
MTLTTAQPVAKSLFESPRSNLLPPSKPVLRFGLPISTDEAQAKAVQKLDDALAAIRDVLGNARCITSDEAAMMSLGVAKLAVEASLAYWKEDGTGGDKLTGNLAEAMNDRLYAR